MFRRFTLGAACFSLAQAIDTGAGAAVVLPIIIGLALGWFDAKTSKPFDHAGLYAIMLGVLFDLTLLHAARSEEYWPLRLGASIVLIALCVNGIVRERGKGPEACPDMRNPM